MIDNGSITDNLAGRTIERVLREGRDLIFCCTDGAEVRLRADVNYEIRFISKGVKIVVPSAALKGGVYGG
jgi:hypothetical protein